MGSEMCIRDRSSSQSERGNLESDLSAQSYEDAQAGVQVRPARRFSGTKMADSVNPTGSQREMSKAEKRKEWDNRIEAMKGSYKNQPNQSLFKGPLRSASPAIATDQQNKLPVVIQTIQFPDPSQPIPLNWKLSKEQKLWYVEAWKLQSAKLKLQLDQYFTPN